VILFCVNTLFGTLDHIFTDPDRSPQAFAQFLEENVENHVVIASWEWEIAFLVEDHIFIHPPTSLLGEVITIQNLKSGDIVDYDVLTGEPEFLILGPFAQRTGIYQPSIMSGHWQLIHQEGDYQLFQRAKT
jgi:hypothetical protein